MPWTNIPSGEGVGSNTPSHLMFSVTQRYVVLRVTLQPDKPVGSIKDYLLLLTFSVFFLSRHLVGKFQPRRKQRLLRSHRRAFPSNATLQQF